MRLWRWIAVVISAVGGVAVGAWVWLVRQILCIVDTTCMCYLWTSAIAAGILGAVLIYLGITWIFQAK